MSATMHKSRNSFMEGTMDRWEGYDCVADVATGDESDGKWATLYFILSADQNKGHATKLLTEIKEHYESKGFAFGGSVALNPAMARVYEKCGVTEYTDDYIHENGVSIEAV